MRHHLKRGKKRRRQGLASVQFCRICRRPIPATDETGLCEDCQERESTAARAPEGAR